MIQKLNDQTKDAMSSPDVAEKLRAAGTEPVGGRADQFRTFLSSEIAQWASIAKANDIPDRKLSS